MAKKPATTQESATGAVPVRVAKPAAPRITSAKHKKASSEPVTLEEVTVTREIVPTAPVVAGDPLDVISKLAYGYWEARGRYDGQALADWVRAEEEYRQRLM